MIAAACLALTIAIAHHPVAQGASALLRVASIQQQAFADELIHGTIMAILLILASGMGYYSLQRGIKKPAVLTACLAYCLATVLGFIAGAFDGFVLPALARRCPGNFDECLRRTEDLLGFASICVQVFSRISLLLMVAATLLWSIDLLLGHSARLRGAAGVAVALFQVWFLSGIAYVRTPHTLLAVMIAQIIWYLIVAGLAAGWPIPTGNMRVPRA
jgi:hypothetical protein